MKLNNITKKILQYLVVVGGIALIVFLTRGQWGAIKNIAEIKFSTMVLASAFFLLSQVIAGYIFKLLVSVFDVHLQFKEWFGLVAIRSFGNYLPLSTGVALSATYLKINKNLKLSSFASFFSTITIFTVFTNSILALTILLWTFLFKKTFPPIILSIFVFLFLFCLMILILPLPKLKETGKISKFINNIHGGWLLIKSRKKLLIKVMTLQTIYVLCLALQLHLIFDDLNYTISILQSLLIILLSSMIRLTTIFPGNLGLRESIIAFMGKELGYPIGAGFIASAIGRIICLVWIFFFGIIFSFILLGKRWKINNNTENCNNKFTYL